MFTALLIEGKEPPLIEDQGDAVKVTFTASEISPSFRAFIAQETQKGNELSVDHLLIVQHLLRHPEIDITNAARICQRREAVIREVLSEMELTFEYLERGGTGRGTYWALRPDLHRTLLAPGDPERDRRIDWEAAKTRVLSILKQRMERGEGGLANAEIRRITHLDRGQVKRLMSELRQEKQASSVGLGRSSKWVYDE
jgi:ATP-dependent DNA helicase RecG